MRREVRRTLYSLTPDYQRGIEADEYEVVLVDNGSREPLSAREVEGFGRGFRYFEIEDASPSPAAAMNFGVSQARGEMVTICIDGARILSPGILAAVVRLAGKNPGRSVLVSTLAWHLGPQVQHLAMRDGYDEEVEDRLLGSIDWRRNGYELFRVSCLAESSADGWFLSPSESNCVSLLKRDYERLEGFDESFVSPGGGLVNLDFFERAVADPQMLYFCLLGEGTFHQVHGGVVTNAFVPPWQELETEYRRIRGRGYRMPSRKPICVGAVPSQAIEFFEHSERRAASPGLSRH